MDSTRVPAELEQEFATDYFRRSFIPQQRGMLGILVIAFVFGVLNAFQPSRVRFVLLAVHYFVLCPALAMVVASAAFGFYERWSQQLMALVVMMFTGTYIAFERISPTAVGSEASQTTVVLILVIIASCSVIRLRYWYALVCYSAVTGVYALLSLTLFQLPEAEWNAGAVFAASALGAWIAAMGEKSARTDFLLRRALEGERRKLAAQNDVLDHHNQLLGELAELRLQAAIDVEHEIKNKRLFVESCG